MNQDNVKLAKQIVMEVLNEKQPGEIWRLTEVAADAIPEGVSLEEMMAAVDDLTANSVISIVDTSELVWNYTVKAV